MNEGNQNQGGSDEIMQTHHHEKPANDDHIASTPEHSVGSLDIESQQNSNHSNDKHHKKDGRKSLSGLDDPNLQILDKDDQDHKN